MAPVPPFPHAQGRQGPIPINIAQQQQQQVRCQAETYGQGRCGLNPLAHRPVS